jgi:hypothetical protein
VNFIYLIPDSSVLFYYIYGSRNQKEKIQQTFERFNNSIIINQTIKAEIGRVIFSPYFIVKTKILQQFQRLNEKQIVFEDFWKILNFLFQKTTSHREPEKNRIFTIFANIQDILNQALPIENVQPEKRDNIKIDRIEAALFQIENELLQFQNIMNNWEYTEEFYCHQTIWEMISSDSTRGFDFFIDLSCSSSLCPDRINILQKIYTKNKKIIHDIIYQAKDICHEYNIQLDIESVKF